MSSIGLIILISVVLVIQIFLFIWGRRIRKKEKEENVLFKYNIKSRKDAWQKMANPDTPESDRAELQRLLDGEDIK